MSLRVCTSEYMLSTVDGLGMRRTWFPRIVKERFLESTKDGEITRAPDPVVMIDGDIDWYNATPDRQAVTVQIIRAPRSIVAQNPSTVVIHDSWSFAKGARHVVADYPSVTQDAFGGRAQVNRASAAAKDLAYGRLFVDGESSQVWVPIGVLEPGESMHLRYVASVQTPGVWTAPSEFESRWEAHALWTRLLVFAGPVGDTP
ncbi:hypothetical protein H7I53_17865 [Mycolicibacterium pulveris]|uniref:DUF7172 domain-containing protein n=1 Tax=Mycolicibacterium pulveris TaxID=36813 RepID=A0A7I7UC95_MYCPV|nr:hypothetical protein [Mycolicibacterium pulveris]MCV6982084.1 hypothetical protein [Mycolicibacterium pulveris]BBY78875.1 hypothetical protein MPUL_00330 [Mycolicibacterium pulveris]